MVTYYFFIALFFTAVVGYSLFSGKWVAFWGSIVCILICTSTIAILGEVNRNKP